ncbi:hypothetical protein ABN028_28100 [Actinopolymorpha sp. B17G11]|uniref:hypothetical protein n=1 Tax=Actinopolymorpha sp. B17G11 TaxID=3160861 RepID=UPI0032E4705F
MTLPPTEPTPPAVLVDQKRGSSYPDLPQGWGAVEVTFDFDSLIAVEENGTLIAESPNWGTWVDPPTITIDGNERRASWSVWAYPLPAGPHTVRFGTPGFAERRVEIAAGQIARIKYHADIAFHKDKADDILGGPVRETTATVKVRALKSRPAP